MATESNGSGRLDKLEAIRAKVGERMDQMAERQATGDWQHEQRHLEHEESMRVSIPTSSACKHIKNPWTSASAIL